MRYFLALTTAVLLAATPATAQDSGSLDFRVVSAGPVHVVGEVSGVATYDGLFVYDATGRPGRCRRSPTRFVCDLAGPAHIVVLYVAAAPRCGVRPALRWTAGDEHGVVSGPEPIGRACAHLPAVAR